MEKSSSRSSVWCLRPTWSKRLPPLCNQQRNRQKKGAALSAVNRPLLKDLHPRHVEVVLQRVDEAEVDEMWSFVGKKKRPRWMWHALDHRSGKVLAYVFGRRTDEVFVK